MKLFDKFKKLKNTIAACLFESIIFGYVEEVAKFLVLHGEAQCYWWPQLSQTEESGTAYFQLLHLISLAKTTRVEWAPYVGTRCVVYWVQMLVWFCRKGDFFYKSWMFCRGITFISQTRAANELRKKNHWYSRRNRKCDYLANYGGYLAQHSLTWKWVIICASI